jgi:sigma-B regulation protein RsbU (phosphoserine phosphatase)
MKLEGFPLGMLDEVSYDEMSVILDPGDMLVFYSDGLSDTSNAAGEFYETDRLRDFVVAHATRPAAEIADRVLEEVELFSGKVHAFDDRTLVVLKVL